MFPPSPRLPAVLQTVRFLRTPFSLLHECFESLGPVFHLRLLGLGKWVFVSEPELIKTLFKADPDVVRSGEINSRQLGFLLGLDATFSKDGDDHLRRRRLVLPHFNGPGAKDLLPLIRERTLVAIDRWPHDTFAFQSWAHRLSLDVLGHAMFSASTDEQIDELVERFDRFATDGLRSPLIMMPWLQVDLGRWSPWGRVLELRRRVFDAVRMLVRDRLADREGYDQSDIASKMAGSREADGSFLSEDALVEEIVNDIFAGHETTGNILSWCLECVTSRPDVRDRLREELDRVLAGRPIEASDLRQLPYLHAVIQEAIRYRPLAPMAGMRLTKEPFTLGQFRLPPETIVVQCFPVMANRTDLYRDPERFDPDHFSDDNKPPAYHWNPFGGGRRMCLGKGLAEIELAVIMAEIVRRYDVEICQSKVEPVRDGVFFAPSRGLRVRMTPRPPS
ncbi:MAG: cytochrome P450 [Thermoanaerobaculia bacterium]|nr:cytochrome P450 [Thermoanaerobaculia bacterium]